MTGFKKKIEALRILSELAAARLRAFPLKMRGAHIQPKPLIGRGVRVDRPWTVKIGSHVQIEADVWFKVVSDNARIEIGDHVFIGRGAELGIKEGVAIGNHCLISPGVFMTDHDHDISLGKYMDQQDCKSKPIVIHEDVWIGAKAIILPGVTIGRGAVVGAGAVVTKSIPERAIAAGVPAKVIGFRQ